MSSVYAQITGVQDGYNAFTSPSPSPTARAETAVERNRRLNRESYQRKAADITKFHHAPAFNVAIATADDSRRTQAIKGKNQCTV